MSVDNQLILPVYDGDFYDEHETHRHDIPFYTSFVRGSGGAALELGCGTGRVTLAVAEAAGSQSVSGIDLSRSMIEKARNKAAAAKLDVSFYEGDFSRFKLPNRFRSIFSAYNAVAHLEEPSSLLGFFQSIREHLEPGGMLAFDVWHFTPAALKDYESCRQTSPYFDPTGNAALPGMFSRRYDPMRQVLGFEFELADGRKRLLSHRVFFPREIEVMIASNGFELLHRFGDFDGNAFRDSSAYQVVVCRKR